MKYLTSVGLGFGQRENSARKCKMVFFLVAEGFFQLLDPAVAVPGVREPSCIGQQIPES